MQPSSNEWFTRNGVDPPSHEPHLTEEEIAEQLKTPRKHEWRQKGSVLFCVACPWEHATEGRFTDYLLQGTDKDGSPILKKVGQ
jgi:hypothetical protein